MDPFLALQPDFSNQRLPNQFTPFNPVQTQLRPPSQSAGLALNGGQIIDDSSVLESPRQGPARKGVCKFFNSQKGFGFVLDENPDDIEGQEVFVHYTAIQTRNGFRSLAEGEEVEYELTTGPKGFQAVRLTGPGGRAVMGDPKARLPRPATATAPFMQMAPLGFQNMYGMDYMQQPMFAQPYTSHIVYVPTNMSTFPNGQPQFAQFMQPNQFGQQMAIMPQQQQQLAAMQAVPVQPAPLVRPSSVPHQPGGSHRPTSSGSFGPIGGASTNSSGSFHHSSQSTSLPPPNPQSQFAFSNPGTRPSSSSNGPILGSRINGPSSMLGHAASASHSGIFHTNTKTHDQRFGSFDADSLALPSVPTTSSSILAPASLLYSSPA